MPRTTVPTAARSSLLTLALVLTLPSGEALAATVSGGSFHLGVTASYQFTSSDADLIGKRALDARPGDLPVFGLRAGFGLIDPLSIEVSLVAGPVGFSGGDHGGVAMIGLGEVVGHLSFDPISIDFAAGAGANALVAGELGTDVDLVLSAGIGVRWVFADQLMALRLDARALFSDAVNAAIAASALITLGFDFFLTRPEWSEDDGGAEAAAVDTDGDGLPDDKDACPQRVGERALRGCPDEDGDLLPDDDDACPETPGAATFHGCPDTDADGLPDTIDACPTLQGDERFAGCPDGDDDGVPDGRDKCPELKGQAEREGCPTPPPEVLAGFGLPLDGVSFDDDGVSLLPESGPTLARIAHVLASYPDLRVEVQAHVHTRVARQKAFEVTEARARAVADKLVELGVDPRRVGAVGLGSDRPIASNRNKAGRKRNERVEIHLVQPAQPGAEAP